MQTAGLCTHCWFTIVPVPAGGLTCFCREVSAATFLLWVLEARPLPEEWPTADVLGFLLHWIDQSTGSRCNLH